MCCLFHFLSVHYLFSVILLSALAVHLLAIAYFSPFATAIVLALR